MKGILKDLLKILLTLMVAAGRLHSSIRVFIAIFVAWQLMYSGGLEAVAGVACEGQETNLCSLFHWMMEDVHRAAVAIALIYSMKG
jgi:accessory gene regulator protein AgrB